MTWLNLCKCECSLVYTHLWLFVSGDDSFFSFFYMSTACLHEALSLSYLMMLRRRVQR
jgi:hypothetical protein